MTATTASTSATVVTICSIGFLRILSRPNENTFPNHKKTALTRSLIVVLNRVARRPFPSRIPRQLRRGSMKRKSVWCLLGLTLLVGAARSQAQQTGGAEKAVAALEQQWLQAQKTNNPDLLAPLLADKIVVTEADGKVHD